MLVDGLPPSAQSLRLQRVFYLSLKLHPPKRLYPPCLGNLLSLFPSSWEFRVPYGPPCEFLALLFLSSPTPNFMIVVRPTLFSYLVPFPPARIPFLDVHDHFRPRIALNLPGPRFPSAIVLYTGFHHWFLGARSQRLLSLSLNLPFVFSECSFSSIFTLEIHLSSVNHHFLSFGPIRTFTLPPLYRFPHSGVSVISFISFPFHSPPQQKG